MVKFGGTSLRDAAAISQAASVAAMRRASVIVVSATSGTTNQLVELVQAMFSNDAASVDDILAVLRSKHEKIAAELGGGEVATAVDELLKGLEAATAQPHLDVQAYKKLRDTILAYGELLASQLMLAALESLGATAELIDATELIKTDSHFGHATPLIEETAAAVSKLLAPKLGDDIVVVTQGFIGSAPDGSLTTLGRGGGDYSAALLAEALGADSLEIWTDVAGIASSDPRITKNARKIDQLTFQEAAELATAGAKVLHPKTMTPARRAIFQYISATPLRRKPAGLHHQRC